MARSRKKVALLIDAANCRDVDFEEVLRIARRHGQVVVSRAYSNFAYFSVFGEMAQELFTLGVQLIHCPAWGNGSGKLKSTADEVLTNDIRTLLRTKRSLDRFIICSGDGHFVPAICEIQKRSKEVIVMANEDAASHLMIEVGDKFIPLPPVTTPAPRAVFQTLVDVVRALQKAQSKTAVPSRDIQAKMTELHPGFDETHYHSRHGSRLRSFTAFLKEAQSKDWVRLHRQNGSTMVSSVTGTVPQKIYQSLVNAVNALKQSRDLDAVPRMLIKPKMIEMLGEFDEKRYRSRMGHQLEKLTDFLEEAEAAGWVYLIRQEDDDMLVTTTSAHSQAA